jgi:hypothetical protein
MNAWFLRTPPFCLLIAPPRHTAGTGTTAPSYLATPIPTGFPTRGMSNRLKGDRVRAESGFALPPQPAICREAFAGITTYRDVKMRAGRAGPPKDGYFM